MDDRKRLVRHWWEEAHERGQGLLRHQRAVLAATAALLAVMVVSNVLIWAAVGSVRGAFHRVDRIRAEVQRLDVVQHAVSSQTDAEASYLRSPSSRSRADLVAAVLDVHRVLDQLAEAPDAGDRSVAARLSRLEDRYADDVDARLADGAVATGRSRPDAVAGPTLTSMQDLLDAAVARQSGENDRARSAQRTTLRRVTVLVPVVLLSSVLAVLVCWAVILRQHQRLIVRARGHEWASTHDELTGVPNRTLMWDVLDAELDASTRDLALLLVDLDRFKDVNDTHGHAVGDAVLVAAARRLEQTVAEGDLVARLGGDEFAVLVHPASRGRQVADELRTAFDEPVQVGPELAVRCTATVGCAVVQEQSDRLDLLRRADLDMYAGKPRRSNHAVGEPPRRGRAP